jgi:hypothetical protein
MVNGFNGTNNTQIFWEFSNLYKLLHGWLSTFVCIFGITSNLLNITVLTKSNMVRKIKNFKIRLQKITYFLILDNFTN